MWICIYTFARNQYVAVAKSEKRAIKLTSLGIIKEIAVRAEQTGSYHPSFEKGDEKLPPKDIIDKFADEWGTLKIGGEGVWDTDYGNKILG